MLLRGVTYGQTIFFSISKMEKMKKISYADSPIEKTKQTWLLFKKFITLCVPKPVLGTVCSYKFLQVKARHP